MKIGESKNVKIDSTYDSLIIVPPYFPEEQLKSIIDPNLAKSIAKSTPLNERFYLFTITDNRIQRNIELIDKYATKDNQLLIVTSTESMSVTKISESDHRWFEITKLNKASRLIPLYETGCLFLIY